jgi:hypothetical protein
MPRGAVGGGGRCKGPVGGEEADLWSPRSGDDDGGVLAARRTMLMLLLLLVLQLAVVVSEKEIVVVERERRRDLVLLSTVLATLTGADARSTAIGSRTLRLHASLSRLFHHNNALNLLRERR